MGEVAPPGGGGSYLSVVDGAPVEADGSEWHAEIDSSGKVRESVALWRRNVKVHRLLGPTVAPRSEFLALAQEVNFEFGGSFLETFRVIISVSCHFLLLAYKGPICGPFAF